MKNFYFLFSFVFLFSVPAFSQLTLTVTATPETCANNGSLNFAVGGNPQNNPVLFTIFKLPELTLPYETTNSVTLSGLSAGTYRVIAMDQTTSETAQKDAVVQSNYVPLEFSMLPSLDDCTGNRTMTINVASGNPIGYEIVTGPIVRPRQTSNVFNNLVNGTYLIRVFDSCNNGVTRSFTLEAPQYVEDGISILETVFTSLELPSCNTINIGHYIDIAANYFLAGPITFTLTVYPPDGSNPIIVTNTLSGGFMPIPVRTILPRDNPYPFVIPYFPASYTYDIKLTDNCGNVYERNGNIVNRQITASIDATPISCGSNVLAIGAENFVFPITVNFTQSPAGFVPQNFNASHPSHLQIPTYGSEGLPVPEGNYSVTITDACGRSATASTVVTNEAELILESINFCTSAPEIYASIGNSILTSLTINIAPSGFAFPTPHNVSSFIANGEAIISGILVPGLYELTGTDQCGNSYTNQVTISPTSSNNFYVNVLGQCEPNFGSVLVTSFNPDIPIVEVIFLSGPSGYPTNFPHNVSQNIFGGAFAMSNLPIGNYTARVKDQCGIQRDISINVRGFVENSTVTINEFCSSYNLRLQHSNNNGTLSNLGFWLQKLNPQTGLWQHPDTNVVYSGIGLPNNTNAIPLINNEWSLNLNSGGHFRVVTAISYFAAGSGSSYCLITLEEFDTGTSTFIENASSFSCENGVSDVLLNASGQEPFVYRIMAINGTPQTPSNQSEPLFTGLQNGTYLFEIEDNCQNILQYTYEVRAPFSFNVTPQLCNNQASTLSVPLLNYLTYRWYKQGNETTTLSTTSTLSFAPLNLNTHAGTYFVTISYPGNSNSCLNQTLSYTIQSGMNPNAGADKIVRLCGVSGLINLYDYLDANVDRNGEFLQITPGGNLQTGTWDTAGISQGMYFFNYTVNGFCGETDEAIVQFEITAPLPLPTIQTNSICEGNTLNLGVTNHVSGNQYVWTGPNNFSSTQQNPQIQNANPAMSGMYTVTVTNGNCSSQSSANVTVNRVPLFSFEMENSVICEGQETSIRLLPNSVINAYSEINWWFNDAIFAEDVLVVNVSEPGTYKAEIILGNCSQILEMVIEENLNPFEATASAKCVNEAYILTAYALENSFDENAATYEWTGPENFSGNTQTVDISGLPSGIFTVKITDESGCSITYSLPVEKSLCKIPKGISPNDDGKNDNWDLSGLDILKVKIFNRYGTLVYEMNDYVNQWNGRSFNGNLLPTATYFYYLKLRSGEEKTGWVYLNREVR